MVHLIFTPKIVNISFFSFLDLLIFSDLLCNPCPVWIAEEVNVSASSSKPPCHFGHHIAKLHIQHSL